MSRQLPRLTPILLPALIAAALASAAAPAADWKAGVARQVITPKESVWMAGFASRDHPSEGLLHDLWAKALVLEDPTGQTAAIVTIDVCGIGRDLSLQTRDKIAQSIGLGRDRIVLACSHTHSGPVVKTNLSDMYPLDEEQKKRLLLYAQFLEDAIVNVVGKAYNDRLPATLSWTTTQCDFAVNRRENDQPKTQELRSQLALKGPVDHDVPVLLVSQGTTPRAILFQYACHCTTLSGYQFSGDYAGFAQIAIETQFPGAQAMFLAGCGADQNPLPRGTVELATQYGEQLASSVRASLGGPLKPLSGPLRTAYTEIDLRHAPIPDRASWEKDAQSDHLATRNRAKRILALLDSGKPIPDTYPYPIQIWRLGDELTWFFLGGEVTVDYSLRLKRNLGSSRTWVAAYCNDVTGYIPSLRVLKEGGYEGGGAMVYYGLPAPWSDQVEDQIISAIQHQLQTFQTVPAPAPAPASTLSP